MRRAGAAELAQYEHERRPVDDALIGSLEPVRSDNFHRRNVQARRASGLHRCPEKSGAYRDRTDDLRLAKAALSQLS
jgi:hypothetical protein